MRIGILGTGDVGANLLGDITAARGMEIVLPLWVRLYGVVQSPKFNHKVVR